MSEPVKLQLQPRLADPDLAFRMLIEARRGLTIEAAAALDARLVLLLANHIGDAEVLREAIGAAQACIDGEASKPE